MSSLLHRPDSASIAESVAHGQSMLIVGEAGVGKTFRGARIAGELATRGWTVERVAGSASMRTLPFGAVHHLIGDAVVDHPDALFGLALRRLRPAINAEPVLIFIDDIDCLDDQSLALIHRLTIDGITVLATTRRSRAGAPHVVPLWKDGLLERIDVVADASETAALITTFLDATPSAELVDVVTTLTGGNPLFIRELVADGVTAGSIRVDHSEGEHRTARLDGTLTVADRVTDVVAHRLDDLTPDARSALDTIALCAPIAASVVVDALGVDMIDELERRHLVRVVGSPTDRARPFLVEIDHPLVGEVVRAGMPSLGAQATRARIATVVLADSDARTPDLIRALHWTLDADRPIEPLALRRGAEASLGRFDADSALRFCDHLPAGFSTSMLRGHALVLHKRRDEALAAFAAAVGEASCDDDIAAVAQARAAVLRWIDGDVSGSDTCLRSALADVTEVGPRSRLTAELLLGAAVDGNLALATELGPPLLDQDGLDESTELSLLVITTIAQALTLRTDRLSERIDRGLELAARHRDTHPVATAQLTVTAAHEAINAQRLDDASAVLCRHLPAPRPPSIELFSGQSHAMIHLLRGDGEAAIDALHRIESITDDVVGMTALRDAVAAHAYATTGDSAASNRAADAAMNAPGAGQRERSFVVRARSQLLALTGDIDGAVESTIASQTDCGQNNAWYVAALHDLVRFGRPHPALERMDALLPSRPPALFAAMRQHARALSEGDVERLGCIARQWADDGLLLHAAEATAQAAAMAEEPELRARLTTRAHALFAGVRRCRSVAVEACAPVLSSREFEVARLASDGRTTRQIADLLVVSARTVDNHLHRSFAKLGLAGRAELASIFR